MVMGPVIALFSVVAAGADPNQAPAGPNQVSSGASQTDALQGKGPKIAFDKTEFDMGEVSTNSKGTGTFKFTNTGDAVLEIPDVVKCCGANVQIDKPKLQPGETGVLTVEYSTGWEPGTFKKELTVHCNDKANPSIKLTILGKMVQRLVWKPIQLKLFLNKENLGAGTITLTALDGKPFSVKGHLCTADCITLEYDPNAQATEFVLKTKVDKDKLAGMPFPKGTLQIRLNRPDYEIVPVAFDLLPNYSVIPAQIIIFNVEPGKKETRKVTILDNYASDSAQADFAIDSVKSEGQSVAVAATDKIKDGYQLTLGITPPVPNEGERSFSDELHVKPKDGEDMKVVIRLFYAAKVFSAARSSAPPAPAAQ